MIIGWENISAFKEHIEKMESFRRAHINLTPNELLRPAQPIPDQAANSPFRPSELNLSDGDGKNTVVSIWDVSLPKGTEN